VALQDRNIHSLVLQKGAFCIKPKKDLKLAIEDGGNRDGRIRPVEVIRNNSRELTNNEVKNE
jgi:hypothetical protein